MRGYGKREGLNWLLLLWRFLVAVCEMAEFVCHTPDHHQGMGGRREGGKKESSKSIKTVVAFTLALFPAPAFPVQV
jgi:hypothetical protein